jgi:DNA-binding transcriptional MerR regulator
MHLMARQNYFNAQEIAGKLGISKQTLIRYEKKGVFPESRRNPVNKWREYTESDLGRLREILGRI